MNEAINKRSAAVGLFIAMGLLFLIAGVLAVGNLHSTFSKKIIITTIFGDVNGLVAGNNIWFSGVKIGTVKKLEFYGNSQVKVLMNINTESKQYIRKDAKVKISSDGLIGNKILVVYGGTSSAPEVEEGDSLSNEMALNTDDMMETLQKNNLNVLEITKKLAEGQGTIGKLLSNDSMYNSLAVTANSLQMASADAKQFISKLNDIGFKLNDFSSRLNEKGTLVNDLISDSIVFNSIKASVLQLNQIADTATALVNNLKEVSSNPKSPLGLILHDEAAGKNLKTTLINLESSSAKLDEDLEALQHNFLLRRYFKKEKKNLE